MTDRVQMTLFGLYMTGWLVDWSYWIATGRIDPDAPLASGIIGGFFVAWFWPLHGVMELWRWALA